MKDASPILHAKITNTPLDLVSERLFFIIPLSKERIEWLNTIIYKDDLFWINYWSLTHTLSGLIYGVLYLYNRDIFSIKMYIILHTIFEIWEFWALGETATIPEIVDSIIDTLFGLTGVLTISLISELL